MQLQKPGKAVRVTSFNASLARKGAGVLIHDIAKRDAQVLAVVEILQHVRPDIILINELDHDPAGAAMHAFADLLSEGVAELEGLDLPHRFTARVNTGVPSGFDLDKDGRRAGPRDAWGYGRFPGQYGMAILSRFPLGAARTFQKLTWASIPWAEAPQNPDGTPYYAAESWNRMPLSSKSHWDVAVTLPDGRVLHLLASHPTPPVFDGPEDRNGLRNAAEIRFWVDYLDNAGWVADDDGEIGGLPEAADFVLLGDLNNDPEKGDGKNPALHALLSHQRVQDPAPTSPGAAHAGAPGDTADWPETDGPGNLRVDYVLPSTGLTVLGSGVFWPEPDDPLARLVGMSGDRRISSDHRLVWVDLGVAE
ncbi:MAG: endonuclease/exonuclease/phosphatase family protein [Pseudomonadota bacterium]